MAITEPNRHQMYDKLREVLGDEDATTLMEHLPPVGWADVATRRDLDHNAVLTRNDLRSEMAELRADFIRLEGQILAREARLTAMVHKELATMTRTFIIALIGAMATIASLAFAAAHLS